MQFTVEEIAQATGGEVEGPPVTVSSATIDSRRAGEGQLFVPIVAERDGHDFIPAALAAGCPAYLTQSVRAGRGTAIVVDDTAAALTDLGRAARERLVGASVVGITGSVGKTSVKDLVRAAVAPALRVHANEASFNNELGLPLTLFGAPDDTEVAVVEMGARGVGHIAQLCDVARPAIGVVTRVAGAHTELFGDLDGVAAAKGELVEALPTHGVAVLNGDDHRVAAMAARTSARVLTYGSEGDVRLSDVEVDDELRVRCRLDTPWGSGPLRLRVSGRHMASNAAAAAAVAGACGVGFDDLVAGLEAAGGSAWRMEVHRAPTGALVVNDAYNANPTSVRAALDGLSTVAADRRIAVLGEMAELGDERDAEHRAVAAEAREAGIRVIAVACPTYGDAAEHVDDVDGAATALGPLDAGDAVLVKGSRVAALERLVERLVGPGAAS